MRRRSRSGTTTIEFAVTAGAMVFLILGILEAGLMLWSWQVLEGAAADAARCAAIDALSCQNPATTPAKTASYAASVAVQRGLSDVTAANVTVATGTTAQAGCGNTTASVVRVSLSYTFGTLFVVPFRSSLTASACFPIGAG